MSIRSGQRFDYVYINIKMQPEKDWFWIKARNWSARGFNFFSEFPVQQGSRIEFKKGLEHFEGEIIWQKNTVEKEQLYHMAFNSLLSHQFIQRFGKESFDPDFVEVLRTPELGQKLNYAQRYLSIFISKTRLELELAKHHWIASQPQYGVRLEDPTWEGVVESTLGWGKIQVKAN